MMFCKSRHEASKLCKTSSKKIIFQLLRKMKENTLTFWWHDRGRQRECITTMLRYFKFEPSFKLRWCRARDLFGLQIPVTTGGFEMQISCIQSRYLTH